MSVIREAQVKLADENPELIIFSKTQFKELVGTFESNDLEEFSYQGKQYDVEKIIVKGNRVFVYCMNDQKEEQLLSELESSYTHKTTEPTQKKENSFGKQLVKDFFPSNITEAELFQPAFLVPSSHPNNISTQFHPVINCPPPNTFIS